MDYSLEYVSKALGLKFKRSYHNVEKRRIRIIGREIKKTFGALWCIDQ